MFNNKICKLLDIKYPIIQGGMVWVSGYKLAANVSLNGCLGVIGAGSMRPSLLKIQITKALTITDRPIAVNLPLLYDSVDEQIEIALDLGINIFITSAGSPKRFTSYLKSRGCTVGHVVSSEILAKKCEDNGVDFIIAEGFEAGGHNGREELTTMVLIPDIVKSTSLPIVAAGGISNGSQMLASLALGASGCQLGTRFLMSEESSAHINYKNYLLNEHSTKLLMKKHIPVRLLDNDFSKNIYSLENNGCNKEDLISLLGKGRAKLGMLDGDIKNGELEIGQTIRLIKDVLPVKKIIENLISEYVTSLKKITEY